MKSSKQEILKSLDKLSGITEASLFRDFEGFASLHAHDKPYGELAHDYLRRGIVASENDRQDDAIEHYDMAIRLDPNYADALRVWRRHPSKRKDNKQTAIF